MTAAAKKALEEIREVISKETDPKKLSKREQLEVIEEVYSDLYGLIDALEAELEEEG